MATTDTIAKLEEVRARAEAGLKEKAAATEEKRQQFRARYPWVAEVVDAFASIGYRPQVCRIRNDPAGDVERAKCDEQFCYCKHARERNARG